MFYQILCLIAIVAVAFGQQWTIDTTTTCTYVIGVGAGSASSAVAAGAVNGVGSVMESYNGAKWTKTQVPTLMLMGAAMSKSGTIIGPGMGSILVSNDGVTYTAAAGVKGMAQTADAYGTDRSKFAVAGSWSTTDPNTGKPTSVSGVAYSVDTGASFSISNNIPAGYVRYGAYPSDSTWYVASGIWGNDPASANKIGRPLSARVHYNDATNQATFDFDSQIQHHKYRDTNSTGWFGAVSKTTDGGNTWTQVLSTNLETDYIYFNEISCGSESNCVVVGEGDSADGGYLTVAYTTVDGGATWEQTWSSTDVSLMTVKFTSASEVWIVPTKKTGRTLAAQFMKSTDGGKTFSLVQSLDNCMAADVDFADGVGYAACLSSSGSSGSVAMYK